MTPRDLKTKRIPSQKAGSLNEGCFSTACCMYRYLYSCHINMPTKLTLPLASPLKIKMTRTRFTLWSKAPTLQASSPDIPSDLSQHLLKVSVGIHLGLQGSPHLGPIPAAAQTFQWTSVPASPTHTGKTRIHNLWDEMDLMMNARKSYVACEDKSKGFRCYNHGSYPTTAKVLVPCPPTTPP